MLTNLCYIAAAKKPSGIRMLAKCQNFVETAWIKSLTSVNVKLIVIIVFFFNRQRYDIVNKKMCTLKVVRKKTQSMAKTASAHEMVPIC